MSAHSVSATAHPSLVALTVGLAVALVARGLPAQAPDALLPALRGDVEPLLHHDSPIVRGEAAIALAVTRDPRLYDEVLKIANDPRLEARLRGIVALGYLAQPSADAYLGELLLRSPYHAPERAAAALALALLPDALPIPALDEYFREVDSGSYRRHRDVLAALLCGFMQEPHPSRGNAMVALLLDDANREPDLRRLAMTALAPIPTQLARADLPKWLASPREPERLGALTAAAKAGATRPPLDLDAVERIARRDRSAKVRAAALRLLTDVRHRSCLEIASTATRSSEAEEAAAGAHAICRLGGSALCERLEKTILAEERPEPQAALLEAFEVTPSTEFAAACLALANGNRTLAVRAFAAAIAARDGDRRTGATLRRLFLESDSPQVLTALARSMCRLDPKLFPYDRIYPAASEDDLRLLPARLGGLLTTGDPTARALLATALRSTDVPDRTKAALLGALRAAAHPGIEPEYAALLPAELREIFS